MLGATWASLCERGRGTVWAFKSLPGHTFDMGKNQAIEGQGGIQKKGKFATWLCFQEIEVKRIGTNGRKEACVFWVAIMQHCLRLKRKFHPMTASRDNFPP